MKTATKRIIGFVTLGLLISTATFAQRQDDRKGQKPPSIEQIFKELDANEDGKLSKKEVKGPLKNDFKKIDTNEDGFISKEELEKAPKPERKERLRN